MQRNITELDVELATLFYPVLVELARKNEATSYGGLKDLARAQFPEKSGTFDRCTDQSVGRRLEVVRLFTEAQGYPDISALVLNQATGRVGKGYAGDAEAERTKIASFSWDDVTKDFEVHVEELRESTRAPARPRQPKRMTEREAQKLMVEAARGGAYRRPAEKERLAIIEQIRNGLDPLEALSILVVEFKKPAA